MNFEQTQSYDDLEGLINIPPSQEFLYENGEIAGHILYEENEHGRYIPIPTIDPPQTLHATQDSPSDITQTQKPDTSPDLDGGRRTTLTHLDSCGSSVRTGQQTPPANPESAMSSGESSAAPIQGSTEALASTNPNDGKEPQNSADDRSASDESASSEIIKQTKNGYEIHGVEMDKEMARTVAKYLNSRDFKEEREHMRCLVEYLICCEVENKLDSMQFMGVVPISELKADPHKWYLTPCFSVIVDFCVNDSLDREWLRNMDITSHDRDMYMVLIATNDRIQRISVSRNVHGIAALDDFLKNSGRRVKNVTKFSKILPLNSMFDGLLAVLLIAYYNSPKRRISLRFNNRRSANNQSLILLHMATLEKEIKQL